MARELINDIDANDVIGGSIVFNASHTTCGYNRNDQYKVNSYSDVLDYVKANKNKMSEKKMLSNLCAAGVLSPL